MEFLNEAVAYVQSLEAKIEDLERQVLQRNLAMEALLREPEEVEEEASSQKDDKIFRPKHVEFLDNLEKNKDSLEYVMTEHLRMQGAFWMLGAYDLLQATRKDTKELCEWVFRCYDRKRGGFGGNEGHDAHILYTQHAVYVLAQCDALEMLDHPVDGQQSMTYRDAVVSYVKSMQKVDGSFQGDEWGEIDTRFTYCAAVSLAVLGRLDAIDCAAACNYVLSTRNELDGGFGCAKSVESHSGYVFTALGALSVLGGLKNVDDWDSLAWWLAERQCDSGGLNGRPEKLADVCYSWWVLSSLHILNRLDWIDKPKLVEFILACQDPETGGIADHPDNVADVYHTFFGLCGLSLVGYLNDSYGVVDPVYALPKHVVEKLDLTAMTL